MSVGESLAQARQQRGLSVEDVSAATRIRGTLIRAIEADEFGPCGGAVYARGHIRSIARVVGADPTPLVAEYDSASGAEQPAVVPASPGHDEQVALANLSAPVPTSTNPFGAVRGLVGGGGGFGGRRFTGAARGGG